MWAAYRWECLSLGACEHVAMPFADAAAALGTVSSLERFELLLKHVRPAVQV